MQIRAEVNAILELVAARTPIKEIKKKFTSVVTDESDYNTYCQDKITSRFYFIAKNIHKACKP